MINHPNSKRPSKYLFTQVNIAFPVEMENKCRNENAKATFTQVLLAYCIGHELASNIAGECASL